MTNDRTQRAQRAEKMRKEREKADKRQRNLITVGIVAIVVVLIGIATFAINTASDENTQADELTVPQGATDDYGLEYTPADAAENADAPQNADGAGDGDPVRVVLYEDLQCPACQAFEQANGQFLAEQVEQGNILLEFRYVNMLDNASLNEYSSRAANAVVCAYENGGPSEMKAVHDALYADQPAEGTEGPEDGALLEQLESAGVSGAESCVNRGVFVPWINDSFAAASEVEEFEGTPTVFVDGEVLRGAEGGLPQVSDLQTAIDEARSS